jgi:hypothetical protein
VRGQTGLGRVPCGQRLQGPRRRDERGDRPRAYLRSTQLLQAALDRAEADRFATVLDGLVEGLRDPGR